MSSVARTIGLTTGILGIGCVVVALALSGDPGGARAQVAAVTSAELARAEINTLIQRSWRQADVVMLRFLQKGAPTQYFGAESGECNTDAVKTAFEMASEGIQTAAGFVQLEKDNKQCVGARGVEFAARALPDAAERTAAFVQEGNALFLVRTAKRDGVMVSVGWSIDRALVDSLRGLLGLGGIVRLQASHGTWKSPVVEAGGTELTDASLDAPEDGASQVRAREGLLPLFSSDSEGRMGAVSAVSHRVGVGVNGLHLSLETSVRDVQKATAAAHRWLIFALLSSVLSWLAFLFMRRSETVAIAPAVPTASYPHLRTSLTQSKESPLPPLPPESVVDASVASAEGDEIEAEAPPLAAVSTTESMLPLSGEVKAPASDPFASRDEPEQTTRERPARTDAPVTETEPELPAAEVRSSFEEDKTRAYTPSSAVPAEEVKATESARYVIDASVPPVEDPFQDNEFSERTKVSPNVAELASAEAKVIFEEGRGSHPNAMSGLSPVVEPSRTRPFLKLFEEFMRVKQQCGESLDGLTYEKFEAKVKKKEAEMLAQKQEAKRVRFSVYVNKEGKAALKATLLRD